MVAAARRLIVQEPASLSSVVEELAASRLTIEKSFLDMGQRLLDSSRLLRDMTAAQEGMPAELQGEDFAEAVALLHRLRQEAMRIASHQDDAGARVARMMAMAREFYEPIDSLNKSVRNLGLIAINARIIAAGMTGGGGDFDSFAQEMVELGRNAARIVAEFSQMHRKLVDALRSALDAGEVFGQKHGNTLPEISGRLIEQLGTIEQHKTDALADVAETGRIAGKIASRIGQAVSALQIGDITRQRLEHVEAALADIDAPSVSAISRRTVLNIQELQLEETRDDFAREVDSVAAALGSLSGDARAMLEQSRAKSDMLLANGGTALAGLVGDLGSMALVLADFEAMRARTDTLRAEVTLCLRDMQDSMDAISTLEQTMRLLSINTSVRCSRLGDSGRALRVVAQEMRELAAHTVEAAETVTRGLEQSSQVLYVAEDGQGEDVAAEALSDDASAAIRRLEAVVSRLRGHTQTIAKAGPRTAQLLQEAAAASAAYGRHARDWDEAVDALRATGAGLDSADGEPDRELLARIRQRYTMVAERRIHDEICGAPGEVATEPAAPEGEAELDDVFF